MPCWPPPATTLPSSCAGWRGFCAASSWGSFPRPCRSKSAGNDRFAVLHGRPGGFAVIWLAAALPENWSKIDVPSFDDQNLILAIVVMVLLITSQFWIFGLMLSFS